jgi:hypothetical protein
VHWADQLRSIGEIRLMVPLLPPHLELKAGLDTTNVALRMTIINGALISGVNLTASYQFSTSLQRLLSLPN